MPLALDCHWTVHVPVPPLGDAVKVTEPPRQIPAEEGEMFTEGSGTTVTIKSSYFAGHGPEGSLVVRVSVIDPVKLEGGVYVAFNVLEFGEKDPPVTLADHVPVEAPPPTTPDNGIEYPAQTVRFSPASTVAAGLMVKVIELETA